jgi:hypothetical protein
MKLTGTFALVLTGSLALAQGGFDGPGRYEIANLKSGKVLDLDRIDQTTVIQSSARGTEDQTWDITPAGPGFYFIRNGMNGKALEAARDSSGAPVVCTRFDGNPNQQWRFARGREDNALMISSNGVPIQTYDLSGDANQRFVLRRIKRGPDRVPQRFDRDRNLEPDQTGRFWDPQDQMWKLAGDGVCFYERTDFRGEARCTRMGNDLSDLGRDAPFLSVRLFGRAEVVEAFEQPGFRGERVRLVRDERDLRRMNLGRVGSFRVALQGVDAEPRP